LWNQPCLQQVSLILRPITGFYQGVLITSTRYKVHSVEQKSIGMIFSNSRTGSDVRYSCHHNSSRFTFPIFAHSWRFSIFHSLQSITPRIY